MQGNTALARSIDPTSGLAFGPDVPDTTPAQLDAVLAAADVASQAWAITPRQQRGIALTSIADSLDSHADELVALADAETALGLDRLRGEVARTSYQLKMFAELLADPGFLAGGTDEHVPGPPPEGRPQLHQVLVPIGPVAVFAASNFPFAFSVMGGDTASALAAGCAVVVKAHPAHPRLSLVTATLARDALLSRGWNPDVIQVVSGHETGRAVIAAPQVRAVAFTGSQAGGMALLEIARGRPDPIPFYGELGSVNPVFITPGALSKDNTLATDWITSLTLGAGQFCTNPSLIVAPRGAILSEIQVAAKRVPNGHFLTQNIERTYFENFNNLASLDGVRIEVAPTERAGAACAAPVGILSVAAADFLTQRSALLEECFGPAGIVIEYDHIEELLAIAQAMNGCLVAAVHGRDDDPLAAALVTHASRIAGRVVWNGWPTGLSVSPHQHHGGPFPASTDPLFTSVGGGAARRFVRPVVFQSVPAHALPEVATASAFASPPYDPNPRP
jgi:NADP-dependent aldehyde dehydrogenase